MPKHRKFVVRHIREGSFWYFMYWRENSREGPSESFRSGSGNLNRGISGIAA